MEIAALILGIVAFVISLFPFCGVVAIVPALVGFILGIVSLVMKSNKSKAMPIVGVVLSSLSVLIMIFWFVLLTFGILDTTHNYVTNRIVDSVEQYYEDYEQYPLYEIGEQISVDNRTIVVENITRVESNRDSRNRKEIVIVDISMKNVGKEDVIFSPYYFSVVDENYNVSFQTSYQPTSMNTLKYKIIKPDETLSGVICFEVERYSDSLTLIYDDHSSDSNKVRINLDKISEVL